MKTKQIMSAVMALSVTMGITASISLAEGTDTSASPVDNMATIFDMSYYHTLGQDTGTLDTAWTLPYGYTLDGGTYHYLGIPQNSTVTAGNGYGTGDFAIKFMPSDGAAKSGYADTCLYDTNNAPITAYCFAIHGDGIHVGHGERSFEGSSTSHAGGGVDRRFANYLKSVNNTSEKWGKFAYTNESTVCIMKVTNLNGTVDDVDNSNATADTNTYTGDYYTVETYADSVLISTEYYKGNVQGFGKIETKNTLKTYYGDLKIYATDTVAVDSTKYKDLDTAIHNFATGDDGTFGRDITFTLYDDQIMTAKGLLSGFEKTATFKSSDPEKRRTIWITGAANDDVFDWDWVEFNNIIISMKANESIHNFGAWQWANNWKPYKNNKMTFTDSEITGLTTTDCISVFGINNLTRTTVQNNKVSAMLFANRADSTISNSTITGNIDGNAVQITDNSTTTITDSTINNNTNSNGADVIVDVGSTAKLTGNTTIGSLDNDGTLYLAADFTGSVKVIPSATIAGTVIATVEDGADVSDVTVDGLDDNMGLLLSEGTLKIAEKPQITDIAKINKESYTNDEGADSTAAKYADAFKATLKANGWTVNTFTVNATCGSETKDISKTLATGITGEGNVTIGFIIESAIGGVTINSAAAAYVK